MKHAKADKAWQQAIIERDMYCVLQGRRSIDKKYKHRDPDHINAPITGHHIIGRRHSKTRHDLRNGVGLCPACHQWAHANPVLSEKMIIDILIESCIISSIDEWYDIKLEARK